MKILQLLVLLILTQTSLFSQIEKEIYFYDSCNDSITKLEFELLGFEEDESFFSESSRIEVPKENLYLLVTGIEEGDWVKQFSQAIEVAEEGKEKDTLTIPRILFTSERALHSTEWKYMNCKELCDGHEVDYYPNGNLRIEGEFNNGKPTMIKYFRIDGTKESVEYYKPGTMIMLQELQFDEKGQIEEKIVYVYGRKNKLKKKKIYNGAGELQAIEKN